MLVFLFRFCVILCCFVFVEFVEVVEWMCGLGDLVGSCEGSVKHHGGIDILSQLALTADPVAITVNVLIVHSEEVTVIA